MSRGFSDGFSKAKKDGKDSLSFSDKAKLIASNLKSGVSILLDGNTVTGTVPVVATVGTAGAGTAVDIAQISYAGSGYMNPSQTYVGGKKQLLVDLNTTLHMYAQNYNSSTNCTLYVKRDRGGSVTQIGTLTMNTGSAGTNYGTTSVSLLAGDKIWAESISTTGCTDGGGWFGMKSNWSAALLAESAVVVVV